MKACEELVDFLAAGNPPERVAGFEPSEETRQRAWSLVQKEKEAGLTEEETAELETFAQLEHLMRLVKARAKLFQV